MGTATTKQIMRARPAVLAALALPCALAFAGNASSSVTPLHADAIDGVPPAAAPATHEGTAAAGNDGRSAQPELQDVRKLETLNVSSGSGKGGREERRRVRRNKDDDDARRRGRRPDDDDNGRRRSRRADDDDATRHRRGRRELPHKWVEVRTVAPANFYALPNRTVRSTSLTRATQSHLPQRGARAELPLLGGSSRSLVVLASWLAAPLCGLLLLLCCRPVGVVLDEAAGKSLPLLPRAGRGSGAELRRKTSNEATGGSPGDVESALKQERDHQRHELLRVLLLLFPSTLRLLPARWREFCRETMAAADGEAKERDSGGARSRAGDETPARGCTTATPQSTARRKGPASGRAISRGSVEMVAPSLWAGGEQYSPTLPRLLGSECEPLCILSEAQREHLLAYLPASLQLHDWHLRYSTEQHGCSLRQAYLRLDGKGPSLLVILDSTGAIFGAFATDSWHVSSRYFGTGGRPTAALERRCAHATRAVASATPSLRTVHSTHPSTRRLRAGESFLFTTRPSINVYSWSGANSHFQLGSTDSIAMGSGGKFGLRLDESFEYGSSGRRARACSMWCTRGAGFE